VNGYKVGETLSIRRPTDFTVREGAVMQTQDVVEGKTTITVDRQRGIDFRFTSSDMTLKIDELGDRVLKPAMVQLANKVETDVLGLYYKVPSWVGTPGQTIDSFGDFYKGPERLNELAVPMDMRTAALSPADEAAMLGSQTALYINGPAQQAYRSGNLGEIGGVDTWMSQNVPTHINGAGGTNEGDVRGTDQFTTYDAVKNTWYQDLSTDGWGTSEVIKAGDVFTIDGVYAVNPVTKATLPFLRQFTVLADVTTASNSSNETVLRVSPPIIPSGAQQTVSAAPANDATITRVGAEGGSYRQNLVFHKNAFALVMVPMEKPQGAVNVTRKSYNGISTRLIPVYDGTNDINSWRMDILYGVEAIDPRLATRLSGTSS